MRIIHITHTARDYHDPAMVLIHALQQQQHEQKIRQVVDPECCLVAIC
jgi:hypothetical protein